MLLQKCFSFRRAKREPPFALRKILEKAPPSFTHARQMLANRPRFDPQHSQHVFGVARKFLELIARNAPPKVIARHIFDLVRLVEHHRRIFRQDGPEIVLPYRQVRKKQMMIHDNQVRFLRPLVHRRYETPVEVAAFLSRA